MSHLVVILILLFTKQVLSDGYQADSETWLFDNVPARPPFSADYLDETASGFSIELWQSVEADRQTEHTLFFAKWLGDYPEEILYRALLPCIVPSLLMLMMLSGYLLYRWRAERVYSKKQILIYQQRTLLALEGGELGLWDWDLRSDAVYFNERWSEMLGYRVGEIEPHLSNWQTLVHPEDWQASRSTLQDHLQAMLSYFEAEHRMLHRDGHWIWVLVHGKVMETSRHGQPLRMAGTLLDITERKNNQYRLETLLTEQNAMLDNEMMGMAKVRNSRFVWTSSTFEKILGYDRHELIGESTSKLFINMEAYQHFSENCFPTINSNKPFRVQIQHVCKDGRIKWVDLSCNFIDKANHLLMGVMVDVTKQKLAEDEKREALDRINKIACQLPGVIYQYCLNPDGSSYFPYASAGVEDIYRVSQEQVRQDASKIATIIHPDDYDDLRTSIWSSARSLKQWQHEYRVKFDDGTIRWLFGNALPQSQEDGAVLWHGFISDVTERRLAERELKISQERLDLALQGANDGLWDWNFTTNEVYYSPRWKTMLGYAEHELENTFETWSKRVHPDEQALILRKMKDYINGKTANFEVEFRMLHKDGHWLDILSRAKLAADSEGKLITPRRLIGTHVDISERKSKEQQRLNRELAQRDVLVREVHHRIKNNIQGITGILRQFAEAHPETVVPINQAIGQMKSLGVVYGLQGRDSKSSVQLSELLTSIAKDIETLWNVRIELDLLMANGICSVSEKEAVPLALVLNELLSNAVKHAGHPEQVNVILRFDASNETILILIRNKGLLPPGFDFENRREINTGLNLVASLLPRTGVRLCFKQQDTDVVTLLECQAPVVSLAHTL
ncbi:MAG: PAS domain-containing protein [Methylococcaceae bacterium]|nr:PAS domain-containing protein [Methylococcaceae bacterium]